MSGMAIIWPLATYTYTQGHRGMLTMHGGYGYSYYTSILFLLFVGRQGSPRVGGRANRGCRRRSTRP